MKFWDSSAIIPLLVQEKATPALAKLWKTDPYMFVWWGTDVECTSALARLERSSAVSSALIAQAFARFQRYSNGWNVVQPLESLRELARRLLRVHPLRAADALQLAAAVVNTKNHPSQLDFVCLDARLADAAKREGFNVISA